MGVAQKTTFSNPESLKKIFGVFGDLVEYNECGKPLKRLSSLTNPKSAGLLIKTQTTAGIFPNLLGGYELGLGTKIIYFSITISY